MLAQKGRREWPTLGGRGRTRDHRTLAEKAFIALHEAILTGELRPGERIPIEDLASALEMSPMPVREAVRRLDALGLVENVPHKGARITELSIGDLRGIYEARLALEPLAVYRAAQQFDEEAEAQARKALAAMRSERSGSVDAWRAHSEFHFSLYRAARSAWLLRLIQPPWESSERYRLTMDAGSKAAAHATVKLHEVLLRSCIDHDADRAAIELYNHLVATANSLAVTLGSGPLFAHLDDSTWSVPPATSASG
ncbi:MAG TPA: GntR family transcriptional regulator [Acidimicrobiales bacterium]|nr:GntR family transcriptional regulator [Acidimicrobiales bacterium]